MIRLLGIPYDASSSFLRGSAEAPAAIREALETPSANLWTETGVDLEAARRTTWSGEAAWTGGAQWCDDGDLAFETVGGTTWSEEAASTRTEEREHITNRVASILQAGDRVLTLGGDHSISYPVLRAYSQAYPNLTVVQFDAHPDLYEDFEGDRYSHACPFARIMEEGLARQLVQVGVRTMTGHQARQCTRFAVTTLEIRDGPLRLPALEGPVYVSLDLDVLDPAFAPGVSHREPGGLSTRGLLDLIHSIKAPIVGADVVELNPVRDQAGLTTMVAGRLVRELLGKMLVGLQ